MSKLHMWAVTSDESIEFDDEEGSGYTADVWQLDSVYLV